MKSYPSLTRITEADIDEIALGAAVLGTGGGGDPHIGALMAKRLIRLHGPVRVIGVNDLADDDIVPPVGAIGSPSVVIERPMADDELTRALAVLEEHTGRRPTVVMPIEVGGGNSMVPIAAAAVSGLPILDGDAMGRAFPENQMVTFHLAGYEPGPVVMVDHLGNDVVIHAIGGARSERIARAVTVEMGGSATAIDYVHTGAVVRECAIPGTLSLARHIGRILLDRDADPSHCTPADRLCEALGAFRLFDGKVADLQREVRGGFTRGVAHLAGLGADKGGTLRLDFQNEMLLARVDDRPVAVTPDLIAVLDLVTGRPITTETLRYGARVTVIGLPAHSWWRTERGLETAGPAYFGYDVPWAPVEELARQARPASQEENA